MGWVVNATLRSLYSGKDPVPIVEEAGWASEQVRTGAEDLDPTGLDLRTVQPVASRYTDYAFPALTPAKTPLQGVPGLS